MNAFGDREAQVSEGFPVTDLPVGGDGIVYCTPYARRFQMQGERIPVLRPHDKKVPDVTFFVGKNFGQMNFWVDDFSPVALRNFTAAIVLLVETG